MLSLILDKSEARVLENVVLSKKFTQSFKVSRANLKPGGQYVFYLHWIKFSSIHKFPDDFMVAAIIARGSNARRSSPDKIIATSGLLSTKAVNTPLADQRFDSLGEF